jgi:uncharacterized protein
MTGVEMSTLGVMPVVARVQQLWVFPVKSMLGAPVQSAEVLAGGLQGDRSWAVVDESGATVTAAQEPRLREVGTRVVGGEVLLDVPGAAGLRPPEAGDALSAWLGRPLTLAQRAGGSFVNVAPVHVVSTLSIHDAAHAEECDSCDIHQPRANLVLDLVAGEGGERDWLGRALVIGTVTLPVVRHPDHCLGVYAEVAVPGTVHVGDEVTLG